MSKVSLLFLSLSLLFVFSFSVYAECIIKTNDCNTVKWDSYWYDNGVYCTKKDGKKICLEKNEINSLVKILPNGKKRVIYDSEKVCKTKSEILAQKERRKKRLNLTKEELFRVRIGAGSHVDRRLESEAARAKSKADKVNITINQY